MCVTSASLQPIHTNHSANPGAENNWLAKSKNTKSTAFFFFSFFPANLFTIKTIKNANRSPLIQHQHLKSKFDHIFYIVHNFHLLSWPVNSGTLKRKFLYTTNQIDITYVLGCSINFMGNVLWNGVVSLFLVLLLFCSSGAEVVTVDVHAARELIRSGHRYLDVR